MDKKDQLIDKIIELEAAKKELQSRKYLEDLYLFNTEVLKVEEQGPLGTFHKELCDLIIDKENNKKLLLVPRGHLKSTLVTVGYSLLRICKNPSVRILIANATYNMATAFLSQIKKHLQGNETLKDYYGDLATEADKWSENMISVKKAKAFQRKEATVTAVGVDTAIVSQHYDVIIMDDVVNRDYINTSEQIEKTILFYKDALDLLEPNGTMIIIGCLVAGSKVLMADGSWKPIEKVEVGEKVLSHGSIETVEAMIPQGVADVYELKTRNNTIQATPNHPFLTKSGFKRLDELKVGDKIKVLNSYNEVFQSHLEFSENDMWLLGFMLGDGWITEHPNKYGSMRWVVCFARGVYEETNNKVLKLWKEITGNKIKLTKGGYYRTTSVDLAMFLKQLGFKGKAKTKRIPKYVFGLENKLREAFLDGFMKADGYINNGLRCTELANKNLIRDIKHLAELCGYKVSNIYTRTREIQAPHSPKPVLSTTHNISIGNKKSQDKWRWSPISSIEYVGEKETYDLTVSNTHNFVAEGMVVHNTRWHDADLYGWILDKTNPERAYESFSTYINKAYSGNLETGENLKLLWPEKFTQEILQNLKKEKGPYEFCLPGEAPILMSNFIEKQICSIRPGEEIIGFTKGTPEDRSKLVKSKVLKTTSFIDDLYELEMESGNVIRCTKTHNWYTGKKDKTHKLYKEAKVGSKLSKVCNSGWEIGIDEWLDWKYLAGMFDGDGSAKSGGCLNITQGSENIKVIKKIEETLIKLNLPYTKKIRNRGSKIVKPVLTFHLLDNYNTSVNLLRYGEPGKSGQIVKNLIKHGKRFIKNEDRVLSIKKIDKQRVYGLETETGNYVAYGYASGNSTQYMNDPIPQENADFKLEWFKQCLEDELKVRQLNFFTMVDPAISQKKSGDKTAIVTIAVDEFNNWFVVNIIWDHLNPKQLIDHIFWSAEQFHQKKIGIEMVAFQKSIRYAIHDEMRSRNFYLPVVELKAERSKEERIRGLVPRYANGGIYHLTQCPYREALEDELMRFPRGKHDDIIDALAYALQIAFPAKKPSVHSKGYTDDKGRRSKYLY